MNSICLFLIFIHNTASAISVSCFNVFILLHCCALHRLSKSSTHSEATATLRPGHWNGECHSARKENSNHPRRVPFGLPDPHMVCVPFVTWLVKASKGHTCDA